MYRPEPLPHETQSRRALALRSRRSTPARIFKDPPPTPVPARRLGVCGCAPCGVRRGLCTFFSGAGMGPVMMLTCHTRECLTTHPQPLFGLASSAPSAGRRAGPVPRRPPTPRRGADGDARRPTRTRTCVVTWSRSRLSVKDSRGISSRFLGRRDHITYDKVPRIR